VAADDEVPCAAVRADQLRSRLKRRAVVHATSVNGRRDRAGPSNGFDDYTLRELDRLGGLLPRIVRPFVSAWASLRSPLSAQRLIDGGHLGKDVYGSSCRHDVHAFELTKPGNGFARSCLPPSLVAKFAPVDA